MCQHKAAGCERLRKKNESKQLLQRGVCGCSWAHVLLFWLITCGSAGCSESARRYYTCDHHAHRQARALGFNPPHRHRRGLRGTEVAIFLCVARTMPWRSLRVVLAGWSCACTVRAEITTWLQAPQRGRSWCARLGGRPAAPQPAPPQPAQPQPAPLQPAPIGVSFGAVGKALFWPLPGMDPEGMCFIGIVRRGGFGYSAPSPRVRWGQSSTFGGGRAPRGGLSLATRIGFDVGPE